MPQIQILKVKLSDLPPDHKVVWVGQSQRLPTDYFAVTAPDQPALHEQGHRELVKALLWLINPHDTLASFGECVDCKHCHIYKSGGGMVEAGPYTVRIPALNECFEGIKVFEFQVD